MLSLVLKQKKRAYLFKFFRGKDFQDIKELVLRGGRPEIPQNIPQFWKDIIEKCLRTDPTERPTFDELKKSFENNKTLMNTLGMIHHSW